MDKVEEIGGRINQDDEDLQHLPMQEYQAMQAFQDRADLLTALDTCREELETRRERDGFWAQLDREKTETIKALRSQVARLREALMQAQARIQSEADRNCQCSYEGKCFHHSTLDSIEAALKEQP